MHSYRKTGNIWTVGFERTAQVDSWRAVKTFPDEDEACAYVCWLNGGAQPHAYLEYYLQGYVITTDTNTHKLLSAGGDPVHNIVALAGCQIANTSSSESSLVALLDGNDTSKAIGFMSCPKYDSRDVKFVPPLVASPGNDIYCASADPVTTIYVAAQGHKLTG